MRLIIYDKKDSTVYKINSDWGFTYYQTSKDIIPGGNDEIILVNQNYFMNGDFFDVTILEVK